MTSTVTINDIEETVADAIAQVGPARSDITRDATLQTLDIDSLDLVEVAQIVEEEFGVKLVADDAERLATVGDVYDLVYERAHQ